MRALPPIRLHKEGDIEMLRRNKKAVACEVTAQRRHAGESPTRDAINVPVTVFNDSPLNVEPGGQVVLRYQKGEEQVLLQFPAIASHTSVNATAVFYKGYPDVALFRFSPIDHSGDWYDMKVSDSGGFNSMRVHLQ